MEFQSRLLDAAVNELSRLPGIGRKTALRLALHLLRQDEKTADALGTALMEMRHGLLLCFFCIYLS